MDLDTPIHDPDYVAHAQVVSEQRDSLLKRSDWIVIKSQELGVEVPLEWRIYRQSLRDITSQEGYPYVLDWPTLQEHNL